MNLFLKRKLKNYIEENKDMEFPILEDSETAAPILSKFVKRSSFESCEIEFPDVSHYIENNKDLKPFQQLLFEYIDKRNLKDSDVYNKVHIDRRLFSKIRSDESYHPSKETILLLGFSLKLNEEEIINLLESASYSLPKNNYYDLIIRFCFKEGIYDIKKVNDLLDYYHCKLFSY